MSSAKVKRFATTEREREVCGTVQDLACTCGGEIRLTGTVEPLYACMGDCGATSSTLFALNVVPVGAPRLGPA